MLKKRQLVILDSEGNKKTILAYLRGAMENMGLSTPHEDRFDVPSGTQMHSMPIYKNLYVLDHDEPVVVGDYSYNHQKKSLVFVDCQANADLANSNAERSKVIGTSDIELRFHRYDGIKSVLSVQMPQLPIGFIHKYAKLYSLEKEPTHIMVEYDEYATVKPETQWIYAGLRLKVNSVYIQKNQFDPTSGRNLRLSLLGTEFEGQHLSNDTVIWEKDLIIDNVLTIDPKDNTITVRKCKEQWSREEHVANIRKFAKEFVANTDTAYKKAEIDQWIRENLI